jgi:uncharacterized membrane protein YgcG
MASKTLKAVLLLSIAGLSSTACSSNRVYLTRSLWADHEVVIDGKGDKWQGTQALLEKEQLFVSFLNDRENLYIGLVASQNPTGARIMRQGLTVWFDPKGGKNRTFGIKYPPGAHFARPSRNFGRDKPEEIAESTPEDAARELEIVRSEKGESERIGIGQAKDKGLEVKVTSSSELFVYELKIPLLASETRPLAIGAQPGSQISVGLETTAREQNRPREGGRGGTEGGGMGRRGGMGGRFGGGGGGRREFNTHPDITQPLKCWLIVQLANK